MKNNIPITDISIHVSSPEDANMIGTSRFIRIKKSDAATDYEMIELAIKSLRKIQDEYKEKPE